MMMNGRKFMTGLGIGMVAGGALCMMMAPKAKRNDGKRMVSRAPKGMGDVIDDVPTRCAAESRKQRLTAETKNYF